MEQFGRTLLIANPISQSGKGMSASAQAEELLRAQLGDDLDVVLTEYAGHAIGIAAEASGYDTIIALGGDGILHEAVNGLMQLPAGERPRFGVIPVGSGNDYARTLGMSESVPDAIVQFIDAHEVLADLGRCNGEYFTETLSFGLDAAIALDTVERRKRTGEQGTILYLKSGIDQLLHHLDAFEFEAKLRGAGAAGESDAGQSGASGVGADQADAGGVRALSGSMHMFAVQVGPTYGGGFRICPDASITDGLLDICYAAAPMNVVEATVKFLSAKDAHHLRWRDIFFERASSLEISFDRQPPCQIDGEPHIADSYSIASVPKALRVLVA